nr:orf103 [Trichoplusia ni single nucleopolyhedrovirus]
MNKKSIIDQYVSLQNSIMVTFTESMAFANDFDAMSPQFINFSNRFKQHQQTFCDLKLKLNTISDADFRNKIINYMSEDEKIIKDTLDLFNNIVNQSSSGTAITTTALSIPNKIPSIEPAIATVMTAAMPTETPKIDFVAEMNRYLGVEAYTQLLNRVQDVEMQDFKFSIEFEMVLNTDIASIEIHNETDISRYHCLILLIHAFFFDNIRGLDFTTLKAANTPLKIEKLKCIFNYFINMFNFIRLNNESLIRPIIVHHASAATAPTMEKIRSSNQKIDPNMINIEQLDMAHAYNARTSFKSHDLILDYAELRPGLFALEDSGSYEDILFMKHPELYAVAYFIEKNNRPVFGDNDSYIVSNIIQYNLVKNALYESKFYSDAINLYGIVYVNILMFESCDIKTHAGSRQSDVTHLERMILKLYSGLLFNRITRRHNNDIDDEPDAIIRLHAGAGINDCTENKTFQFLIELLVCTLLKYKMCYCVKDFQQLSELNDVVEAIGSIDVARLYFKLSNYNFNLDGSLNFRTK